MADNESYEEENKVGSNWRNLIFVHFNTRWQWVVCVSLTIQTLLVIYEIFFVEKCPLYSTILYYILGITFFADTVFSTMHRNMQQHAKLRIYKRRNLFAITVDIITLIPYQEVISIIYSSSQEDYEDGAYKRYIKGKIFIRLYRLIFFFSELRQTAGINQVIIVTIRHYIYFILISSILACCFYSMGCWMCKRPNWTLRLNLYLFDPEFKLSWYTICFCIIAQLFTHNTVGIFQGETVWELLFFMIIMLCGFIYHIMVFNAQLTAAYIKMFAQQFDFVNKKKGLLKILKVWDIAPDVIDKFGEYYKLLWVKRNGVKKMPKLFYALPLSFQKDIYVDMYWEALRHSHIYQNFDMSFKRNISSVMQCEFFMPGDYLLKVNDRVNKMYYLETGIIQIHSDEDDESPIVSLSSGTIIGEVSSLLNCIVGVNVQCATYCEMYTLKRSDLFRIIYKYHRNKTYAILNKVYARLKDAKEMNDILKAESQMYFQGKADVHMSSIKWLKNRWKVTLALQKNPQFKLNSSEYLCSNVAHSSEYLDLLALSADVELKMQAICLSGRCPYIFEPDSSLRKAWDYLHTIVVFIFCCLLPYYASFTRQIYKSALVYLLPLYLITTMDIYIQISTAIKLKTVMISKFGYIIIYCCKNICFLIDVLATAPINIIMHLTNGSAHYSAMASLNMLLKVYKILVIMKREEQKNIISTKLYLVLKYIILYGMIGYWLICVVHLVVCFEETCDPEGWYIYNYKLKGAVPDKLAIDVGYHMVYYVLSIFLAMGGSNCIQYRIMDSVLALFITIIGYTLYSFCFSELCATTVRYHLLRTRLMERQQTLAKIMQHVHLKSNEIRRKILNFFGFIWYFNSEVDYLQINKAFEDCSNELTQIILYERIYKIMRQKPLFENFNDDILKCIIKGSKLRLVPPNCPLATEGILPQNLLLILKGFVRCKSFMAGDYQRHSSQIYTNGDTLGVIESLHHINWFVNAQTVTVAEILFIPRYTLMKLIRASPDIDREFQNAIKIHLVLNRHIIFRLGGKIPPQYTEAPSMGQGDFFSYEIYDHLDYTWRQQYIQPFNRLGKWSVVRFIMLKRTINPKGKFFLIWECIRCSFVIITIVFLWFKQLLPLYETYFKYTALVTSLIAVPDMYIRMHCQYSNPNGILVKHPMYTAKHYLTTSFCMDLLSTLPLVIFDFSVNNKLKIFFCALPMILLLILYYRIHGLLSHLQMIHPYSKKAKLCFTLKAIILFILMALILSSINIELVCRYDIMGAEVIPRCTNLSWITKSNLKVDYSPENVLGYSLYIVGLYFTTGVTGGFIAQTNQEIIIFILLFCGGFIFRWYILTLTTSSGIVGNTNLISYRGHVAAFVKFMDNEYVDETLTEQNILHFEHVWKKSHGTDIASVLERLTTYLHRTVAMELYGETLSNVSLFLDMEIDFYSVLCVELQEMYFKKDSDIIRCNDVQPNIYIVHKGRVDVIVANYTIATLGPGGLFGNFTNDPLQRQTIRVCTKFHTDVLVIDGVTFQRLCKDIQPMAKRLSKINALQREYFEPIQNISVQEEAVKHSMVKSTAGNLKKWKGFFHKINSVFLQDKVWYKCYNYLMCVHIAPLCSLYITQYIIHAKIIGSYRYIINGIDVLFLLKIYFNMHVSYVDTESGVMVTSFKLIIKRYVRGLMVLDIICLIPLDLFVMIFSKDILLLRYFYLNRIFRILYLETYYHDCKNKLAVNVVLKWTHLIYWLIFINNLVTFIWYMTAFLENNYTLYDESIKRKGTFLDSILANSYVINVFTATGMKSTIPNSLVKIILTVAIGCLSLYLMGILTSTFASILVIENFRMTEYEYNLSKLQTYLEVQNVSPVLIKSAMQYLVFLWQNLAGELTPVLIQKAPYYLKQDIMMGLYSKYIENHPLFARTHVDFIRQLVCFLKRHLFFPGMNIVEKGDNDNCLYFIHRGEVEQYEIMGGNLVLIKVLNKGSSFGEGQGLYSLPHRYTYKAITLVEVLMLRKFDWIFLLKYFPASKLEIEQRSAIEGLLRKRKNYLITTEW